MPRVVTKKPKSPKAKPAAGAPSAAPAPAAPPSEREPMFESAPQDEPLRPPTKPVEADMTEPEPQPEAPARPDDAGRQQRPGRDKIAKSLNIAKLQAMQMSELNTMAKEFGVENFGTMRKHEVIFHILQKNAERAGVLFSEGVIEVLPEGFGFLRSQSFNYLPCPEDIYVSPSQIRRFDLQTGNLVAGQIRPPKEKEKFF